MKKTIVLGLILLLHLAGRSQTPSVYSQPFITIDGNSVSLQSFQGKKLLFVVLSSEIVDTARIRELKEFVAAHDTVCKVFGILSYENGYVDSLKNTIKQFYNSKIPSMVLSSGIRLSNPQNLGSWLLKNDKGLLKMNTTLNNWDRFIINEKGRSVTSFIGPTPFTFQDFLHYFNK